MKLKIPGDVSIIHWDVNREDYATYAGPEQDPHEISSTAVDLVIRHEFGLPKIQKYTLVEPTWHSGPSMSKQTYKSDP